MALENDIQALIEALNKNTAVVSESMKMREAVMAMAGTAAAPAAEKTKAPAAEKTKAPAADKKVDESPKEETVDAYSGIKELIAGYLGVDRPEERAARQAKVLALLNHEKIKKPDLAADAKPDASNIAVGAIDLFKKQIAMLKDKGDLTTPEADSLV